MRNVYGGERGKDNGGEGDVGRGGNEVGDGWKWWDRIFISSTRRVIRNIEEEIGEGLEVLKMRSIYRGREGKAVVVEGEVM